MNGGAHDHLTRSRPLGEVLDELAADDIGPASGTAAALTVAMAAATLGKAAGRSRQQWDGAGGAAAQAEALRARATDLAEQVGEAYVASVRALREPATEPGAMHDFELGRALGEAARVPALVTEAAGDVALLAEQVAEHGDADHRADAVAAALLADGAARAAAHLVRINLIVTEGDERAARADEAVAEIAAICGRLSAISP